jgi:hypothetical protein
VALPILCYFSVFWHTIGVIVVVAVLLCYAPTLAPASFLLGDFNNDTGFQSSPYVAIIGFLAAASTFTGYGPYTRD